MDSFDDAFDKGLEVVVGVLGRAKSCSARTAARFFAEDRYINCLYSVWHCSLVNASPLNRID